VKDDNQAQSKETKNQDKKHCVEKIKMNGEATRLSFFGVAWFLYRGGVLVVVRRERHQNSTPLACKTVPPYPSMQRRKQQAGGFIYWGPAKG